MPRHTQNLIVIALLLAGCAAESGRPELSAGALGAAGTRASAPLTQSASRCAFDYAQCLLRDPFAVLPCTEQAEECGLFEAGLAAGSGMSRPSPDTSPTCALKLAQCIALDPFRAPQCARTTCQ